MKKLATIKNCGLKALIITLCLAIVLACLSFTMPFRAFAEPETGEGPSTGETGTEEGGEGEGNTDSSDNAIATGITIEETVDYGDKFTVGAKAKVTTPSGEEATVTDGKVIANQVGNYTVEYTNDAGVSYKYYVKSRLDEEYFLRVDYNGADIPSYIKYGEDSSFVLPYAHVYYYDDDNVLREYEGSYSVKVLDSRKAASEAYNLSPSVAVEDRTFVASHENAGKNGKVFLTYVATLGNEKNAKRLTETFTVNIQASVPEYGNPTLSVSGVQKDVSINRAVTLPKATATDTYDDNVKVEITVKGPDDKKVRNVLIDDDGYAYAYTENEEDYVVFDNDQAMTFYPRELGTYEVKYVAYNDSYKEGGSNGKSSERVYYITVSDLVAPVFKTIDEHLIPETWGMKVIDASGYENEELSGKVHFTVPTVVDNKDKVNPDEDHKDDKISVYFRIYDSDNSKTVIEFTNILANNGTDNKATVDSSVYDDEEANLIFDLEKGFTFDFAKYKREGDKTGTYTVLYRARDKANNTSSKTYTITLQDEWKDEAAPTTAEVTVDKYLSATEKTLTIPYPQYADADDTRPQVDYRVYNDKGAYISVDGGEVADIKDGKLVIKGKTELELTSALYFYVGVKDNLGNFKSNCVKTVDEKTEYVDLTIVDNAAAFVNCEAKITVVNGVTNDYKYDGKNITLEKASDIKAGDTVNAGWFKITDIPVAMRDYTGFEVAVYDPKGNALNVTLETASTEEDGIATIYVQNIKFTASVATGDDEKYTMVVRVFDVNGASNIYGYTLSGVAAGDDDLTHTSATATIDSTGNVNVKYKLKNEVIDGIPGSGTYRLVRQINAPGAFAIMGSEFTAKSTGQYSVMDGYIADENIEKDGYTSAAFDYENDVTLATGSTNFTAIDEAAPVIEVLGDMPTYWAKYVSTDANAKPVELPKVIAYTDNGDAFVEVEVRDSASGKVKVDEDENGVKSFKATKDGVYTVTYTATYKNADAVSATYYINVGDIDAPEFTVTGGTVVNSTYKVGDKFTFGTMELKDDSEKSDIKITKKLIDPSKETVSDATVDGYFSSNYDKENNGTEITFTMAGEYEVVYTATDVAGNPYTLRYTITVVSSGSSSPTTWTTLSTVLIVVAVVLLAGVIVYVVRFRKVKK
ncbi:MAG: hypothetical protein HDT28_05535 [Clostridiales bacterium]|nr:hypothetical protein [Clostridiales bacterium]